MSSREIEANTLYVKRDHEVRTGKQSKRVTRGENRPQESKRVTQGENRHEQSNRVT
jgi:hypothetical protein